MELNNARIAGITLVLGLVVAFPAFMASLVVTVTSFGAVVFAGAWLADRYGNLPGDDRRAA